MRATGSKALVLALHPERPISHRLRNGNGTVYLLDYSRSYACVISALPSHIESNRPGDAGQRFEKVEAA